jgi:hypothetical protein
MDDAKAKDGKTSIIAVPIITDRAGVFFMPLEKDKPMVCEVRGVKGLYLRESKPSTGKFNMVESRGAMEHARDLCVGFIHLWKESGFETFEA